MGTAASVLSFAKRPIFLMVLAGLTLRLVLMPLLTYDYDVYHWALVISNFQSGNGLYGLDGYYYTPVWGYLLGSISFAEGFFMGTGATGVRFTDMLPIESLMHPYHIATITPISFNIAMKIPIILCDLAVGYLIYYIVKDRTRDQKKAAYGFALWFFCPIVVYMSGVQGMFDSFSALLFLLTVISIYKGKYFFGGIFFSTAVLLKFFPGFCFFVLIAYIAAKHRNDGLAKRKILEAAAGALIMTVIIMLPAVLSGQMNETISFISGRVGDPYKTIYIAVNALIALAASLYFGYRMYRSDPDKADETIFLFVMLTLAASMLMSMMPQYAIVLMPFLILQVFSDRSYIRCWVLVGVSAFLGAFVLNNLSLLTSLSEYTSLVSPGWLLDGMRFLETGTFINFVSYTNIIANIIEYISILLIFAFYFTEGINKKAPRVGKFIYRVKGTEAEKNES